MYIEIKITENGSTKSCDTIYIPDIPRNHADYIVMKLLVKAYEMTYEKNKKEAE